MLYPIKNRKAARGLSIIVASVANLLSANVSHAAIVEYQFNVPGSSSPSTGTDANPVNITGGASIGADGSGVSGTAGDRAFVNVIGGLASHAADDNAIDTLVSFTISGWLKSNSATTPLNGGRIMENSTGPLILFSGNGNYQVQVDGNATGFTADSGSNYNDLQKWMFFAVTYDGTQTLNNVKFYKGYRNSTEAGGDPDVQLVATATINQGAVGSNSSTLTLMNRSTGDRTLDAQLDNFRIDGTQLAGDASGALTLSQLEGYRQFDIVPEPGMIALISMLPAGLLLRRRVAR